jgi:DNA-binding IclR family transcriptional regulator
MENAQPTPASSRREYTVKSLVKALNILELLAEGDESTYTLTQLSRHLQLHISTVHRLLANLVSHGFVEEAPGSSGYQLSFKVLRMGLQVLDRLDFRRVAEPLLQELHLETQETVHLAILQGTRAIAIEKYGSTEAMDLAVRLGEALPLHCTGVGKILLAYQGRQSLNQAARTLRFPRFTPNTITNRANLRRELEGIREQGYALDEEEAVEGLRCVAGPLFDHTGRVIAAFSVAGPASRLAPPRLSEIIRLVCAASQQISFRLGCRSKG